MEAKATTLGEQRVRVEFNPSNVGNVNFFKEKSAEIINVLEDLRKANILDSSENYNVAEHMRLISLAQTAYEEAAMWAVKAATF